MLYKFFGSEEVASILSIYHKKTSRAIMFYVAMNHIQTSYKMVEISVINRGSDIESVHRSYNHTKINLVDNVRDRIVYISSKLIRVL